MKCRRKIKKIAAGCMAVLLSTAMLRPCTVCYGAEPASPSETGYEARDVHQRSAETDESEPGMIPDCGMSMGIASPSEAALEYAEPEEEPMLKMPMLLAAAAGVVSGSIFSCNVNTSADNVNKVFAFTLTATSSAKQTGPPRWYILFNDYSLTNANVTSPVGQFYTQSIVKNNTTTKTVTNPTANIDGSGQKKFADSISYLCTYADYSASMTITIKNPIASISGICLVSQAANWRFELPRTGYDVKASIAQTLSDPVRNYNLTIHARVPVGQIQAEYGDPTLRYKIVNSSTGKVSWMAITLTTRSAQNGGFYTASGTFSLIQGMYTVTPMTMSRYVSDISGANVNLTSDMQLTVNYSISGYRKFSHAAVLTGL